MKIWTCRNGSFAFYYRTELIRSIANRKIRFRLAFQKEQAKPYFRSSNHNDRTVFSCFNACRSHDRQCTVLLHHRLSLRRSTQGDRAYLLWIDREIIAEGSHRHRAYRLRINPGIIAEGSPCRVIGANNQSIQLYLFAHVDVCFAKVRKPDQADTTPDSQHIFWICLAPPFPEMMK